MRNPGQDKRYLPAHLKIFIGIAENVAESSYDGGPIGLERFARCRPEVRIRKQADEKRDEFAMPRLAGRKYGSFPDLGIPMAEQP